MSITLRPQTAIALLSLFSIFGCAVAPVTTTAVETPPVVTPSAPAPAPTPAPAASTGLVFTQTNDATANAVLVLSASSTQLTQLASVPTGGKGTGGGLQNQASLALNEDASLLFVVNAGSNDFSVFQVQGDTLTLASRTPSGGSVPLSIAEAKGIVYVLNAGARAGLSDNLSAFTVAANGSVTPIPGSTRPLSSPSTSAAQVALSPDASLAVVTERGTAILDTFQIDAAGTPGPTLINASSGAIPFGFQFLDSAHIFVSEEGTNGVSSYGFSAGKTVPITRSARNFQSATCWLAITPSGKFLYTTNTSAGTISAYSIGADSSAALIGASGVAARATASPIDAIVSRDGTSLFVVGGSGIDYFSIGSDGSLSLVKNLSGLGGALNGIVAT